MTAVWLIGILAAQGRPAAFREEGSGTPMPAWVEISEQTICEAMQDDYCLGRYGFTIKQDGTFLAGPSPQGGMAEGRVKSAELQRLGDLVGSLWAGVANGETTCRSGAAPGIKDQVDVTFRAGQVVRAYDLGGNVGKICYIGSWDKVSRLHQYLRKLMTQYYPVPFPRRTEKSR